MKIALAGLTALLSSLALAAPEPDRAVHPVAGLDVEILGDRKGFAVGVEVEKRAEGLEILKLRLTSPRPATPPRLTLKWRVPSHDLAAHWMTGRHLNKTIRPDWAGSRLQRSKFAREAPVSALVGSDDRNLLAFAASDALNTVVTGSGIREEDGFVYNEVTFFTEPHESVAEYSAEVRIDRRDVPYHVALREVAEWWASQPGYAPAPVPDLARLPVYSTWYNYHQSVDAAVLLKEVAVAKELGFESIIVDDGWQTLDSARGYAFTGDWEPERMPDMKGFVDGCHRLGVKVLLWYAVPFVGKNAKAAERFKDKSLRFDERLGAYVLDPRYPEVRDYLIGIYKKALQEWRLDGFKLDFIDRFVADEQTVLEAGGGRDYASVNEATDRMMSDVLSELRKLDPDVVIEFRQPYIGPLIRKYGNIFRASDCPNSYLSNRVKTLDLRLLSGDTAVHADMVMWHYGEPVELAAFQLLHVLFSVPQVSVRLQEIPKDHFAMVRFLTGYWTANRGVLLDGELAPRSPAANYPVVVAHDARKQIVALYGDGLVELGSERPTEQIDVVNARRSEQVVLSVSSALGAYRYTVRDCQGRVAAEDERRLDPGLHAFTVPVSGILSLERRP